MSRRTINAAGPKYAISTPIVEVNAEHIDHIDGVEMCRIGIRWYKVGYLPDLLGCCAVFLVTFLPELP